MKRFILFLAILFLWSGQLLKAEEISLGLDEAIAIALRNNRDVLLKIEDVKKAQAELAEAKAGRLPTLTFTGTASDTRGYYVQKEDSFQQTTQTTLKQVLYQGGKITNKIKYNQFNVAAAEADLEQTKLETVLDIKKAFYTLFLAKEYAVLNKAILDNTQEYFNYYKARYQKGQASESDLFQIGASLSNVKQVHEASLNQVESSQALLNGLLYLEKDVVIKPLAELTYNKPEEVVYDETFAAARQNRPEIREYEAKVKAAEKSIEIAKADNRPTVSASWDYYSKSHTAATTTKNWNDYNVIGITFSWPVFDGWATKAKVEQAIIDLKTTQLNQDKELKDITLELRNAYLDFKSAIVKVESTQAETELYKDAFSVSGNKYKAGIISLLDYQDASLRYEVSLFKHKEALYDYLIAKAGLDKAIGEL